MEKISDLDKVKITDLELVIKYLSPKEIAHVAQKVSDEVDWLKVNGSTRYSTHRKVLYALENEFVKKTEYGLKLKF